MILRPPYGLQSFLHPSKALYKSLVKMAGFLAIGALLDQKCKEIEKNTENFFFCKSLIFVLILACDSLPAWRAWYIDTLHLFLLRVLQVHPGLLVLQVLHLVIRGLHQPPLVLPLVQHGSPLVLPLVQHGFPQPPLLAMDQADT